MSNINLLNVFRVMLLVTVAFLCGCEKNETAIKSQPVNKRASTHNNKKMKKEKSVAAIGILGLKVGERVDLNDAAFREKYRISVLEDAERGCEICSFVGTKKFRGISQGRIYVNRVSRKITKLVVEIKTLSMGGRRWLEVLHEFDECLKLLKTKYSDGTWSRFDGGWTVEHNCRFNNGYSIRIVASQGPDEAECDTINIIMADEDAIRSGNINKNDLDALE